MFDLHLISCDSSAVATKATLGPNRKAYNNNWLRDGGGLYGRVWARDLVQFGPVIDVSGV